VDCPAPFHSYQIWDQAGTKEDGAAMVKMLDEIHPSLVVVFLVEGWRCVEQKSADGRSCNRGLLG
jgi:hypothetical protein